MPVKGENMVGQDRFMNDFTPVTDAEYVYVELVDGSQGKMKKSDLARTMSCLQRNTLYGNSSSGTLYSKVAAINAPSGEAVDYSLSLLLSGGNQYTGPASITILSICVYRGSVKAAKNNLIGNQEVGYAYTSGVLTIWVKREQFTHYTNVSVLSEKGNDVLTSNEAVSSVPEGYVII